VTFDIFDIQIYLINFQASIVVVHAQAEASFSWLLSVAYFMYCSQTITINRSIYLQIPHSNFQRLEHIELYRRMITHRASESVYCTTKRR